MQRAGRPGDRPRSTLRLSGILDGRRLPHAAGRRGRAPGVALAAPGRLRSHQDPGEFDFSCNPKLNKGPGFCSLHVPVHRMRASCCTDRRLHSKARPTLTYLGRWLLVVPQAWRVPDPRDIGYEWPGVSTSWSENGRVEGKCHSLLVTRERVFGERHRQPRARAAGDAAHGDAAHGSG